MKQTQTEKVLEIARLVGILRPRDLQAYGIPREYLRRLHARGLLERVGRGLYVLPDADITEHHTLAEVAKKVPGGVVCLISALRFHDLTTQAPFDVWFAIGEKARRPKIEYLPVRYVRFSGLAFTEGIEEHQIEGVAVRIYNPAKTVVDCFKYRNKIGLDIAIEALKDCRRQRKCEIDQIWHYAMICRVANVIKPYLEAIS